MKDDIERVQFAVKFMDMDLAGLSEARWKRLLGDLLRFLTGQPVSKKIMNLEAQILHRLEEPKITPLDLASVQVAVRSVIHQIVANNWRIAHGGMPPWADEALIPEGGPPVNTYPAVVLLGTTKTATSNKGYWVDIPVERAIVRFDLLGLDKQRPRFLGSSIKDAFLYALGDSLRGVDVLYLRRCPACLQVFFADDKRQEYSSPRCASRMRKRRLRAGKGEGGATPRYKWEPAPGDPDFVFEGKKQKRVPKQRKEV